MRVSSALDITQDDSRPLQMKRNQPTGLMPHAAAREAPANIDLSVADAIGESIRTGVITPEQAEETARRMHMQSVDALFRLIDKAGGG